MAKRHIITRGDLEGDWRVVMAGQSATSEEGKAWHKRVAFVLRFSDDGTPHVRYCVETTGQDRQMFDNLDDAIGAYNRLEAVA